MKTDIGEKSIKKINTTNMRDHISIELEYATLACEVNNIIVVLSEKLCELTKTFTKFHIFNSYRSTICGESNFIPSENELDPTKTIFYQIIKDNSFGLNFDKLLDFDDPDVISNIYNLITNTMFKLINCKIFELDSIEKTKKHLKLDSLTYYDFTFIKEILLNGTMSLAKLFNNLMFIPVRTNLLYIKSKTRVSKTKNTLFKTISMINTLIASMRHIENVVNENIDILNECMKKHVTKSILNIRESKNIENKDISDIVIDENFVNMFIIEKEFKFNVDFGKANVNCFYDKDNEIEQCAVFGISSKCKKQLKDENDKRDIENVSQMLPSYMYDKKD